MLRSRLAHFFRDFGLRQSHTSSHDWRSIDFEGEFGGDLTASKPGS
jgi:hypothetical protein